MNSLESTKCFLGIESVLCVGKNCFWVWWGVFCVFLLFLFVFSCSLHHYVHRVSYSLFPKLSPVFLLHKRREEEENPLVRDAQSKGEAVTLVHNMGKSQ